MILHTDPVPTTYELICKRLVFKPMSGEKRARLKSYRATANALKMGVGLPHAPSLDALQMWARETGRVQGFIYQYYQQENQ